jgi:hypothetical protein
VIDLRLIKLKASERHPEEIRKFCKGQIATRFDRVEFVFEFPMTIKPRSRSS